jgi:hypothetical protein
MCQEYGCQCAVCQGTSSQIGRSFPPTDRAIEPFEPVAKTTRFANPGRTAKRFVRDRIKVLAREWLATRKACLMAWLILNRRQGRAWCA